ncbi:hypothetical protein MTX20_26390 [Bradyrhizobium sp. ISRA435]|nr:hypothetical protein MTX20_26390 [Bradyrhizobium sp. ISRA435]
MLSRSEGYTFHLHPRDEAGTQALSELKDQGVNLVANALTQSMDHISSFFQMLRTELAFYVGCLNLHERLEELSVPSCLPEAEPLGGQILSFSHLYDVGLALSMNGRPVGNDLLATGAQLIVITGANTGGKSTFLRSLGLAQLMLQAGMFVGASAFCAEVRNGVFTHFKREEDAAMESGKLDEELSRMNELVEHLRPGSMLLLNESFATTNEREGFGDRAANYDRVVGERDKDLLRDASLRIRLSSSRKPVNRLQVSSSGAPAGRYAHVSPCRRGASTDELWRRPL